jgi:hypothetical protein
MLEHPGFEKKIENQRKCTSPIARFLHFNEKESIEMAELNESMSHQDSTQYLNPSIMS